MSRQPKYFDRRFTLALLHPKYWGSWLAIGLLVIFGLMPAWLRDPIARLLAKWVIPIAKKPIRVARANLKACFPEKSAAEIEALIKDNVEHFVLVLLSQGELLVRSKAHLRRRVSLFGFEHVKKAQAAGQPIIFIMPHVWPIDYAGLRINCEMPLVTMAKAHKNGLFNWFSNRVRSSCGGHVYMREAGIRALLAELKQNNSFFYLPDEDLGPEQSVFTPFLGTVKATLPVVGRLAQAGNAQVLPVKIGYNQAQYRFELTVMPAIAPEDMLGKENEALALNKVVEQVILAYPEQYMWFLRLLKTRPEGEASIYGN
ncbi:lauroyl-Kdo(2)-lipid IV(A) myristoyltransferase [Shewanella sp. JNE10-2]|uniref:lauroyl-Kdo(2)-lipid IV(A) myristoyltransferase n=1 Tax=unclassified Shewanella TaxID=196818 RepID=UPI0020051865|nr:MULTISPECIES: lauroyl-Kdo(2)-lipid IV(A) myristoyltransferase [unclassified Shewanella]MCK7628780.1 lauroyl-Kdo(2)-lipid IV(A) myristoyltransferase [Shewanella sp. JNE9-1]MCK7644029.1 lauroyl-Kdo(2)-lipid IV(A) myristoyltransferase [Shewanella sp. JNE3-1]MCK7652083.1 lauroyl-Kdo(2)-lipid IV(A) myristoyltransferase [Shewanella sp. JNE4-1]UPO26109.1 lauroyl-Kdo(2)-lipid IV(A) myristoyltransferase [Shewanella sp. JNE10-2]UPO37095.1 lauroyl-Kdo(2)-lipid IV(A) myristoyltransferase [Shewanella sp